MKTMIVSQNSRQGSTAHLAMSRPRKPATIGIHSGSVWISCRSEPGGTLTAPTT